MPESNSGDCSYLSDISPGDKPWDAHRAFADQIQTLYSAAKLDRYAERIKRCGQTLEFALTTSDIGEVALKLRSAHFCRVRHCPVCQWRRSLKWRAKFFQAMPDITAAYPKHRWLFLTLTARNCQLTELRSTLVSMNKAFKRLTELSRWPGVGWIKSVEVTRNADTGYAHPHFHCLLLVPASYFTHGYIKQAEWQDLWHQSLRSDYEPIVNVKAVKSRLRDPNNRQPLNIIDEVAAAVCETLKYSVKEADLIADPDWLAELTNQLHKTRAIAVGGVLRQYLKDESDNDDLVNIDESGVETTPDDPKLWFGWREAIKRYHLMKK